MQEAFAVLGALTVLVIVNDIALTVLHPTVRGPLAFRITRAVWALARRAARSGWELPLRLVGPAALGLAFAAWILGLWVGFALVYLPFEGSVKGSGGPWDLGDALYLSGASLTTVGFGDLVATAEALRLVTILEAISGLAAITAAITYLLSLFGVVSDLRVAAARVGDLEATHVHGAASLALHGGPGEVRALQRDVIAAEEHLRRFPVLYFFHPKEHNEALSLLEAGAMVCLVLRWGVEPARLPFAGDYGRGLERSLARVSGAIRQGFLGGDGDDVAPIDREDAGRRLGRLRAAVAAVDPSHGREDPPDDELRTFLARTDHFLAQLARAHGTEHRPLLA